MIAILQFDSASCRIWRDQIALGSINFHGGRVTDASGAELGVYQRGHDVGRLFLRGRDWLTCALRPKTGNFAVPRGGVVL
jgi:hypothetical protein